MANDALSRELTETVSKLNRRVQSETEAVVGFGPTVPRTAARPTNFEAKNASIAKSSNGSAIKLGFSGLPEHTRTNVNSNDLVAHYGKLYLDDVSQRYRLMKFKPDQIRPRSF